MTFFQNHHVTATLDAKSACSDVDFVIVVALINN